MAERFPAFRESIWESRPDVAALVDRLCTARNEFSSDGDTGRGDSYRAAQADHRVRLVGIRTLLQLATGQEGLVRPLAFDGAILDVLGGTGVLQLASRDLSLAPGGLRILTADIAAEMVVQALGLGLPAIRQAAQAMLLRDGAFDAVIVAYGAHHIPVDERGEVLREAYRVLRPGGRFVLHDFESGSAAAAWFTDVVDAYAPGGHAYRHFTRDGMLHDLQLAGFANVATHFMYDPFRTVGPDAREARNRMSDYVSRMYGLHLLASGRLSVPDIVWEHLCRCFRYRGTEQVLGRDRVREAPTIFVEQNHVVAEVPRVALVAYAERPSGA
jgi:SAM-dependent methyltransferase